MTWLNVVDHALALATMLAITMLASNPLVTFGAFMAVVFSLARVLPTKPNH